jgi:TRAP-type C4-dicarboxylate transport system permease small subunit
MLSRFAAIRHLIERFGQSLTLLSGYALLGAVLMICVDIGLRRLALGSMRGSDELSGYAFAFGTTWSLSYAFFSGSNIRVTVVRQLFPVKARALLDVFGTSLLFGIAVLLCCYGTRELTTSIVFSAVSNTPLRVPLWIPQSLWVSGLILFTIATGLTVVETAIRFVVGDYRGVEAIIGTGGDGKY